MRTVRPAPPQNLNKIHLIVLLLVPLMLLSAYSNSFDVPLALDDFHSFAEEPLVRIDTFDVQSLARLGESKFGWNRWVPMLTFSIDRVVGKGSVHFFHITNFIIHLSAFLAVLFLINGLAKSANDHNERLQNGSLILFSTLSTAVWVAGIWALHPIQTNAVTYIVQRMASIVALFTILSVGCYVSGRLSYNEKNKLLSSIFFCLSFLSMILAFFSKENSAIIPLLIITTELWFFQPDLHRTIWKYVSARPVKSILLFLLIGIPSVAYIPDWVLGGYAGRHFTLSERLLTESRVLMRYVSLVFWPTPGRFSLEHDVELSTSLVSPPTTLLSIIALTAMFTWAVLKRKDHPLITYGIVWFFLNLLVESTFIPLELMFEHRMYLPSIGLILSAVVALEYLARRALQHANIDKLQAVPWCLFLILASALTLATFDRNTVWEHPLALNADNAAKAPNNPRARSNHALALYRSGKYAEAIDEARIAMSVGVPGHEQYAVALNALISSYIAMGEYQTAIQEGERLLDDGPKRMNIVPLPYVHFSMGRAKQNLGDYQDAYMSMIQGLLILDRIPNVSADWRVLGIRLVEGLLDEISGKGIDLDGDGDPDPGGTTPKAWLAETLLRHNQRHAARDLLHEAVALSPQDLYSKARLDEILAEDRLDEAQRQKKNFMDKYVRQPFSRFNACMATSFLIKKNQLGSPWRELGESLLDRAGGLRPDSADVHLLRGWYHHDRGEAEKAVLAAREALKLDPDYANIWLGLGFFSMKANQPRQAMEAFQKSLELYPHAPSRSEILAILKGLEEASTGS